MEPRVALALILLISSASAVSFDNISIGLNTTDVTISRTDTGFLVDAPRKSFAEWFYEINTDKIGSNFIVSFAYRVKSGSSFLPRIDVYFYPDNVDISDKNFQKSGFSDQSCYSYTARNGNSLLEKEGWFEMWGEKQCYQFDSKNNRYNGTCDYYDTGFSADNPAIVSNATYSRELQVKCPNSRNFTVVVHSKLLSAWRENEWEISDIVIGEDAIGFTGGGETNTKPTFRAKETTLFEQRTPLDDAMAFIISPTGRMLGFGATVVAILLFGLATILRIKRTERDIVEEPPEKKRRGDEGTKVGGTLLISPGGPDEEEMNEKESNERKLEILKMKFGEDKRDKSMDEGVAIVKKGIDGKESMADVEKELVSRGFSPEEIAEIVEKAKGGKKI